MLTWNDILDIQLRNKDNPDVALLIDAIRAGDLDDVFRNAVTDCVEDIDASGYEHIQSGRLLEDDLRWEKLVLLCNQ